MFCEETDWLEQEFCTEKWNKISNLNIELSIQIDKFLNKYYMHFTGTGSHQTSQGQKVSAKKHLGNTVTIKWKVFSLMSTYTHTHTCGCVQTILHYLNFNMPLTKWIFRNDGFVSFKRFRFTFCIDSHHSKLVLLTRLEVFNFHLWLLWATNWHPPSCINSSISFY